MSDFVGATTDAPAASSPRVMQKEKGRAERQILFDVNNQVVNFDG
jgi:hypothetical protein